MKTSSILCIALLISSIGAWAQDTDGGRPLFDFRKKSVDAATKTKALEAAKSVVKQVPDELKDKAKELLLAPDSAEMRQKALQAAQAVMQGNNAAEAVPTTIPIPTVTTPKVAVVAAPPTPVGPQAKSLQPLNLDEAPKATKGQIDITAQKSAFFDPANNYGIYTGEVKARHPQMYIECEELELFMAKQEGGALGVPKAKKLEPNIKDAAILAPAKKVANAPPPIDRADARGPMVTIEKMSEDGKLQIGHCKHLIYDGKTETTTLMEWPQVQDGNLLHKATEAGCIMIITKSGKLTTTGGHETIILQGDETAPQRNGQTTSALPPQ